MTVIHPATLAEAAAYHGEYRAGGTDVEARRRIGLSSPVTIDLRGVAGLTGVERRPDGGVTVGALTRIADLARLLGDDYPALASTVAALANPHTRAAATVGGNLLQQTRCWYYRTGDIDCFKTGDVGCPARSGLHHFGNLFDTSSCVAPHPSSLAVALLLHDAEVAAHPDETLSISRLFDPVDPTREHTLGHRILTSVSLPPPTPGERASYRRAAGRSFGDWPLVEAACRMVVEEDEIVSVRVAAGGVGPAPLRLHRVEEALEGGPVDAGLLAGAAALAVTGSRPAPQAAYKAELLVGVVLDVLEEAVAGTGSSELALHERGL